MPGLTSHVKLLWKHSGCGMANVLLHRHLMAVCVCACACACACVRVHVRVCDNHLG